MAGKKRAKKGAKPTRSKQRRLPDITIMEHIVLKGVQDSLIQNTNFYMAGMEKVENVLLQNLEARILGNVLILQGRAR